MKSRRYVVWSVLLILTLAAALASYKGAAALRTVENVRVTGTLAMPTGVVSLHPLHGGSSAIIARTVDYLSVVWPALVFGILISAAVRTAVSPSWLAAAFATRPARAQVAAGLAGAPLMLCSCCVAPIFSAAYERSSRLGPSLALMLAAPALNPAALVLTFMLFPARLGWARLLLALTVVFAATAVTARLFQVPFAPRRELDRPSRDEETTLAFFGAFLRSCGYVTMRTVPPILVGVAVAMMIANRVSLDALASPTATLGTIAAVALVAVPLALPTFFEIPIGLALVTAGAPAGAALAVLFAGPVVNLPSLVAIAQSTSWKVAAAVAASVWLLAVVGGVLVG